MKIIIEVSTENGRAKTVMTVEECFTDLDKGMACYFGEVIKKAIDDMYDGAESMKGCPTCEGMVIGSCPDCGREIGRVL